MKRILKILNKLLIGAILGFILACIEGYVFDLIIELPKDIIGRPTCSKEYILIRTFVGFGLLLFNVLYCLVYALVYTKKNWWYLIIPYLLIIISFYLVMSQYMNDFNNQVFN